MLSKCEKRFREIAVEVCGIHDNCPNAHGMANSPPPPVPKPEHYDGEPCNLPISDSCKEKSCGLRFEYWEKRDTYKEGEWTNGGNDDCIYNVKYPGSVSSNKGWILRAIPVDPPVTVHTFSRTRKHGKYTFRGKPDIPRILRENITEGDKLVVIVEGYDERSIKIKNYDATMIWRDILPLPNGWVSDIPRGFRGWYINKITYNERFLAIQAAIAEWRKTHCVHCRKGK